VGTFTKCYNDKNYKVKKKWGLETMWGICNKYSQVIYAS
jgi:hypothetical protein